MIETYEIKRKIEFGDSYYGYQPIYKGSKGVKGVTIRNFIIKMFHIEAPTQKKAIHKSEKHGGVFVSCRKVKVEKIVDNIENLELNPQPSVYGMGNPYKSAVAMDGMIWQKRNLRRNNMQKDKRNY